MNKTKIIVDTASDIPDEDLARYDIDMLSFPIAIDGKGYYERKSFTIREFYDVLAGSSEIPVTSRIPAADYVARYRAAWEQGYTDLISITINSGGSGTYESSCMAAKEFYDSHPEARETLRIHVVDSRTYSVAYGYPAVQAAIMARQGKPADEILEYLRDFFSRIEIYLACYTLEYAKKSGRITAAAAFVGDMLGLRPIIAMIDGRTKTVEKVRGDKQVAPRLVDLYRARRETPDSPVYAVSGSADEYGDRLQSLLEQETGRPVPHYKAGAAIVINSGPKIAAICVLGKKRETGGPAAP